MTGTINAGPEVGMPEVPELSGPAYEQKLSSVRSNTGLTVDSLTKWAETGAALQKAGVDPTGGVVDFSKMLAAVATGAGTGAAVTGPGAPLGAVIGAIVAAVIYIATQIFNRPPKEWRDAGPGVHQWFNTYGPTAYLEWVRANDRGYLSDVQTANRGLVMFMLDRWHYVLIPGERGYSGIDDIEYINRAGWDWIRSFYEAMGIDWNATAELRRSGVGSPALMLLRRRAKVAIDIDTEVETVTVDDGRDTSGGSDLAPVLLLAGAAYALKDQF